MANLPIIATVLAVVAAIGLLAFGAYMLIKHWAQVKAFFGELWSGLKAKAGEFVSFFMGRWGALLSFLVGLGGQFAGIGAHLMNGLISGVTGALGRVKDVITGAGAKVVDWFKGKLGIHSPSRVFAVLGDHTMAGLALGLDRSRRGPLAALSRAAAALSAAGLAVTPSVTVAATRAAVPPLVGGLALPRTGVQVAFGLGWASGGRPLVPKGLFTVDEVTWETAPAHVTLTARSADFTADLRVRQERAWTNTTLGAVLSALASAHGLEARVDPGLGAVALPVLQQSRESDAQLLARLGRRFGAAATVKGGKLLFLPIGAGQAATGGALAGFTLARADGDGWTFKEPARDAYDGVTASWHDTDGAKRKTVHVGGTSKPKRLRTTFAKEDDARQYATAENARLQRDAATLTGRLALGRPDLFPELIGQVTGLKQSVSARRWLIAKAVHTLDGDGGLTTSLDFETAPAPTSAPPSPTPAGS